MLVDEVASFDADHVLAISATLLSKLLIIGYEDLVASLRLLCALHSELLLHLLEVVPDDHRAHLLLLKLVSLLLDFLSEFGK